MVQSPPTVVYKYMAPTVGVRVLEHRSLRFTEVSYLNDILDVRVELSPEGIARFMLPSAAGTVGRRLVTEVMAPFAEHFPDLFGAEMASRLGVLCLSAVNTSPIMWSHYADCHRGFVLGFRSDSALFCGDLFGRLWPIRYRRDRPVFRHRLDGFFAQFVTKGLAWKHECEWRSFAPYEPHPPHDSGCRVATDLAGNPIRVRDFRPSDLAEIVVGARTTEEHSARILEILTSVPEFSHVRLMRALPSRSSFALELVDVPRNLLEMSIEYLRAVRCHKADLRSERFVRDLLALPMGDVPM